MLFTIARARTPWKEKERKNLEDYPPDEKKSNAYTYQTDKTEKRRPHLLPQEIKETLTMQMFAGHRL